MKTWIKQLFIQPYRNTYQAFYFLNKYRGRYLFAIFVLILAYPTFEYSYLNWKIQQQKNTQKTLTQNAEQQSKLLASLQQHIQGKQQDNFQLTQINQQIKTILDKYQAKVEQWQWNLDQENQLYLSVNHRSHDLLNLLYELNQIPSLYCKDLNITKLHHHHLVQFSGLFILSDKGK